MPGNGQCAWHWVVLCFFVFSPLVDAAGGRVLRTTGCPACETCQVLTYVNPSKCQGYSAVIGAQRHKLARVCGYMTVLNVGQHDTTSSEDPVRYQMSCGNVERADALNALLKAEQETHRVTVAFGNHMN